MNLKLLACSSGMTKKVLCRDEYGFVIQVDVCMGPTVIALQDPITKDLYKIVQVIPTGVIVFAGDDGGYYLNADPDSLLPCTEEELKHIRANQVITSITRGSDW